MTYEYPNTVLAVMEIIRQGVEGSSNENFGRIKVHDTHIPLRIDMVDRDIPSLLLTLDDEKNLWDNDGYAGLSMARINVRIIGKEKSIVSEVANEVKRTLDNYQGRVITHEGMHSIQECRKIDEMSEFLEEESFYDMHLYYSLCICKPSY